MPHLHGVTLAYLFGLPPQPCYRSVRHGVDHRLVEEKAA